MSTPWQWWQCHSMGINISVYILMCFGTAYVDIWTHRTTTSRKRHKYGNHRFLLFRKNAHGENFVPLEFTCALTVHHAPCSVQLSFRFGFFYSVDASWCGRTTLITFIYKFYCDHSQAFYCIWFSSQRKSMFQFTSAAVPTENKGKKTHTLTHISILFLVHNCEIRAKRRTGKK